MVYGVFLDNIWNNSLRCATIDVDFSSEFFESFFGDFEHLPDETKTYIMFSEIPLGSIIKYKNHHHFMRFSECEIECCVIMNTEILPEYKERALVLHQV